MKLTDANKLRDYVKEQINPYGKPFDGSAYEFGLKIIHYIDNMSADYDAENVVDELEKQRDIIFQNTDSEIRTVRANAWNKIDILNKAIEIVKQGGSDDDVCEWRIFDNSLTGEPQWVYETTCGKYVGEEHTSKAFVYCPYCGNKIKIVGD